MEGGRSTTETALWQRRHWIKLCPPGLLRFNEVLESHPPPQYALFIFCMRAPPPPPARGDECARGLGCGRCCVAGRHSIPHTGLLRRRTCQSTAAAPPHPPVDGCSTPTPASRRLQLRRAEQGTRVGGTVTKRSPTVEWEVVEGSNEPGAAATGLWGERLLADSGSARVCGGCDRAAGRWRWRIRSGSRWPTPVRRRSRPAPLVMACHGGHGTDQPQGIGGRGGRTGGERARGPGRRQVGPMARWGPRQSRHPGRDLCAGAWRPSPALRGRPAGRPAVGR